MNSTQKHADGSEIFRHRTPEEIAEIEEQMRKAAKACWRCEDRRKAQHPGIILPNGVKAYPRAESPSYAPADERKGQQRQIVSTFERDMLMGGVA